MTTLLERQRSVQSAVTHAAPVVCATPIVETGAAPAAERMAIYLHGYRARLIEVLGQDFPGLKALLGDSGFYHFCRTYVEITPSRHYNIRWYGSALAEFAWTRSPWSAQPALEEMARFEWELGLAFDAIDEFAVGATAFQNIPADDWPRIRFRLCRSLKRCVFEWNVAAIRKALDVADSPPPLTRLPSPETRAVYRNGISVFHRAVGPDEAAALDVIASGGTFADVCELLCEWHALESVAAQSASLLRRWIDEGWVAALIPPDTPGEIAMQSGRVASTTPLSLIR